MLSSNRAYLLATTFSWILLALTTPVEAQLFGWGNDDDDHHHHDSFGHRVDDYGHHIDNHGNHTGRRGFFDDDHDDDWDYDDHHHRRNYYTPNYNRSYPNYNYNYNYGRNALPPASTTYYSGAPIKIANPRNSGGSVHYDLNGTRYNISPGHAQNFNEDRKWVVSFDRGGGFGRATYTLSPGVYNFKATKSGWNLFKQK